MNVTINVTLSTGRRDFDCRLYPLPVVIRTNERGKKRHFAPCHRPGGINETYIFFAQFILTKNTGF